MPKSSIGKSWESDIRQLKNMIPGTELEVRVSSHPKKETKRGVFKEFRNTPDTGRVMILVEPGKSIDDPLEDEYPPIPVALIIGRRIIKEAPIYEEKSTATTKSKPTADYLKHKLKPKPPWTTPSIELTDRIVYIPETKSLYKKQYSLNAEKETVCEGAGGTCAD